MILGISASVYTLAHVVLSVAGIFSGFVVLFGMLAGKRLESWTAIFLVTTVLTSITGFGFPFDHFLPSHWVGVISLVLLVIAVLARYAFRLAGSGRWIYVVTATMALYLNTFVAVVQAFMKVPALHALAPTQAEPPFAIAQVALLVIFVALMFVAVAKFRPGNGLRPA